MKKVLLSLFVLCTLATTLSFAQSTGQKDYYAGKWEITVSGTPSGDAKLLTNLTRVDGALTGELENTTDGSKLKINKVTESEKGITIYFFAEGMDIDLYLGKKDANQMEGSLMNGSFKSVAVRK